MHENSELYIANTKQYITSDLGEEMILMNLETGNYIALNATSADIWRESANEVSVDTIIDRLMEQYEVDKEVCKNETIACIKEMTEKGLLLKKLHGNLSK